MFLDIYYFGIVIPAVIIALIAQINVKSKFHKYASIKTNSGLTGRAMAESILNKAGVYDVVVEGISGELTDHYDPRTKTIRLSSSVLDSSSIAAVGIAAHEAGHAIQYNYGYMPIRVRTAIIPFTQIGSMLSMPLILLGFVLSVADLVVIGILLFAAVTLFQLITLPVEFNASKRAVENMENSGMLSMGEVYCAKKVLSAAAMTYLAALAVSMAQLLRLILLTRGGRRR